MVFADPMPTRPCLATIRVAPQRRWRAIAAIRPDSLLPALACLLAILGPARAATFTVDTTADDFDAVPGDGVCATASGGCTLRAAIQEANSLLGADVITVPAGTYVLTIVGTGEDAAATGDLDVTEAVTINGAGPDSAIGSIIDGNGTDRVFDIFADGVTISGITIQNGNPGPSDGGGLYNSGALTTLTNVVVKGNTALGHGGGIENINDLTLTNTVVTGNMVTDSIGGTGGGIDNAVSLQLQGVTVSNNTATTGGGVYSIFDLTLLNVTLSGNTASSGGGLQVGGGSATVIATTIAHNAAPSGSGLTVEGDARLRYVLLANDPPEANCDTTITGALTSDGHNLDSGTTCGFSGTGDLSGTDPKLDTLRNNGGPTPTHALLAGSPAIDAGGTDCPPPFTDQRGFDRPADGNGDGVAACDIGAYEAGAPPPPTTTTTTQPPGCPAAASFASITCRLDELIKKVDAAVPQGALRTRLEKPLMNAKQQAGQADEAQTAGKKHRGKVMIGRAIRSVGTFLARLKPRKVQRQIGEALGPIKDEANTVRQAPISLRG